MKEFWDDRYSAEEYIYGKQPNAYFRNLIDKMPSGKILIPGAGEGRDAVYAAKLGWEVFAFDQSSQGRFKAFQLAFQNKLSIRYDVIDAFAYDPGSERFDLIALVFFHLPQPLRRLFHSRIIQWLRPEGKVLVEAFHEQQLRNNSGGPKDISLLLTSEELKNDFSALNIIENTELSVVLNEGTHHIGKADVVRFYGHLKQPD